MSMFTRQQGADLRYALLSETVNARIVAFPAEVLLRRVRRRNLLDFEVTVAEAEAELGTLHALGLVAAVTPSLGGAICYQATAAGVLAHERGQ